MTSKGPFQPKAFYGSTILAEYCLPGTRLWTPSSIAVSDSFVAQKNPTPKPAETKQMA